MSTFRPSPDLDLHYQVDDFTDPWRQPKRSCCCTAMPRAGSRGTRGCRPWHGTTGWCGRTCAASAQSTPMPRDYPWTLDRLIEDFCLLMDHLGIDRFHLVGAKIGGTIARAFAARRPERVRP